MTKVVLLVVCMSVASGTARAQDAIAITENTKQKVLVMAKDARATNSASPSDAAFQFIATFNGAFGDILRTLTVLAGPTLEVSCITPLQQYRNALTDALVNLAPFGGIETPQHLVCRVLPRQVGAAKVERIVMLRDTEPVEPVESSLAPVELTNAFGAKFVGSAGVVSFPRAALAPGATVTILPMSSDGPLARFVITSDELSKLR